MHGPALVVTGKIHLRQTGEVRSHTSRRDREIHRDTDDSRPRESAAKIEDAGDQRLKKSGLEKSAHFTDPFFFQNGELQCPAKIARRTSIVNPIRFISTHSPRSPVLALGLQGASIACPVQRKIVRLRPGTSACGSSGFFFYLRTVRCERWFLRAASRHWFAVVGFATMSRAPALSHKPFIVDVDAVLLKRHSQLSKGARNLYGTMRGLADGKTGELAINGHPLDWRYISSQAEIGRCSWLKYLRELRLAGLVSVTRERVLRLIDGRRYVVLGPSLYVVHRQAVTPENVKNQPILLKSDCATVGESDPQIIQTHPSVSVSSGFAVPRGEGVSGEHTRNHHLRFESSKPDDDRGYASNHFEKIQDKAKAILTGQGESPDFVDEAFLLFDDRSELFGSTPATANYYLTCFEQLKHDSVQMAELWGVVKRKRSLREKYMPGFTGQLSPESEKRRRKFNRQEAIA